MALAEARTGRLAPIVEEVARGLGRFGIKEGKAEGAPAALRIDVEHDVKRIVQVYWTPFQAEIPGSCVALHLEVAEPTVHWAEAYLSPDSRSWVFIFAERPDGEIQLAYHAHFDSTAEAIREFFNLSSWYVLTATDKAWTDVVYEAAPEVAWGDSDRAVAGASSGGAIQESLKKSTIMWLRWKHDGAEHTMPVWYVYDQKVGKVFVLSGERQQTLVGAERIRECDVILRWKGKNSSVAEIPAIVNVITGTDPEWDEIADKIAEKRLNIPGLPEDTARRWRDECVILELALQL
jgi:hypothetical protein